MHYIKLQSCDLVVLEFESQLQPFGKATYYKPYVDPSMDPIKCRSLCIRGCTLLIFIILIVFHYYSIYFHRINCWGLPLNFVDLHCFNRFQKIIKLNFYQNHFEAFICMILKLITSFWLISIYCYRIMLHFLCVFAFAYSFPFRMLSTSFVVHKWVFFPNFNIWHVTCVVPCVKWSEAHFLYAWFDMMFT